MINQLLAWIQNNLLLIICVGVPGILILSGVTKLIKLACIVIACGAVTLKLLNFI